MFVNPTTLQSLIESGESSRTEFKSGAFHNDSLAKEIVAFANMRGGQILVGVEDDGSLSGIDEPSRMIERIIHICRNNILPPLIPDLAVVRCGDRNILVITVEKGNAKPYKVKSSNRYYIRAGTSAIEPTQEELVCLLQNGAQFHFEASALPASGLDDIDLLKVRIYSTCTNLLWGMEHHNFDPVHYQRRPLRQRTPLQCAAAGPRPGRREKKHSTLAELTDWAAMADKVLVF